MGNLYRNRGAPFRAENGEFVDRNAVYEPSAQDLLRRRHKLVPVTEVPKPAPQVKAVKPAVTQAVEQQVTEVEAWPLRMKPETYLSQYPTGVYADLARRILERQE